MSESTNDTNPNEKDLAGNETKAAPKKKASTKKAATKKAATKKAAKKEAVPAIFVRCAKPGGRFRRAGFDFTHQGISIALDAIDDEQLKALRNEPMLVVKDSEITA